MFGSVRGRTATARVLGIILVGNLCILTSFLADPAASIHPVSMPIPSLGSASTQVQAMPTSNWTLLGRQTPGKFGQGFVYASAWNRFIVFGGATTASPVTNTTWWYSIGTKIWWNLTRTLAPSARTAAAMAYDSRAERVILFGGNISSGLASDTWAFDFGTNTWTNMSPTPGPPARDLAAMVYDSAADRILLFGGLGPASVSLEDTWSYDYSTNRWAIVNTSSPGPRFAPSLTYDSVADRTILFGGGDSNGTAITWKNDTWTFSLPNRQWTKASPTSSPSVRSAAALTYDSASNVALLFGGENSSVAFNDTWAYNASSGQWSNITSVPSPPPRAAAGFAYDESVDRVVLYGGGVPSGPPLDDVWTLDYSAPVPFTPTAPRNLHARSGSNAVALGWKAPFLNGSAPVTNYTIYRGPAPGEETYLATVGQVLAYLDTTVVNYVGYAYQVAAVSSAGRGPRSNEVSAAPLPPFAPDAPQSLTARGGPGEVTLDWRPPGSDGGAPVSAYRVYRVLTVGTARVATVGNVTTYRETGLAGGRAQFYEVTAVNTAGEGPPSNVASATPTPGPDTTPPTITIVSPANNTQFTSAVVDVTGTTTDNVGVAEIQISLDGVSWTTANGTTSWAANVTLRVGTNTIYARATDTSGNKATTQITVVLQSPSPPTPPGRTSSPPVLIGTIAILAALAALALAIAFRIRRGRLQPRTPPEVPPRPKARP